MHSIDEILINIKMPYRLSGNPEGKSVTGLATIRLAQKMDLAFIDYTRSDKQELIKTTNANVIICDDSVELPPYSDKLLIHVALPKLVFSMIGNRYFVTRPLPGIHPLACLHPDAIIHPNVSIGPFTYVGKSEIGSGTIIYGNAHIYDNVKIGNEVIIQAGCSIGSDGYGYNRDENGFPIQFPHIGGIIIEDEVDLGANTCIDNGSLGPTFIGYGTKIDNLVHIGHNVQIGRCVYIAALTSIAGSTIVEDNAVIWTGTSVADGIQIGRSAYVGMGSVVVTAIPENKKCFGNPARIFANNI